MNKELKTESIKILLTIHPNHDPCPICEDRLKQ